MAVFIVPGAPFLDLPTCSFLGSVTSTVFCRFQDDLSLVGFAEARSHWDYCTKIDLSFKRMKSREKMLLRLV